MLEAQESEYWCKWTSASISTSATNWIPTNWPARTVYCFAYCDGSYEFALPSVTNFAPAEAHTLHLRVFKTADGTVYVRSAGGGTALASFTGNSIIHRDVELAWRPGIGWICTQTHIDAAPQYSSNDAAAKHVRGADLPEGESKFKPVVEAN